MISFKVFGQPGTKGSAKAFIVPPINTIERLDKARERMVAGGKAPMAIVTNDAGESAKTWASVVSDAARAAVGDAKPLDGALRVRVQFHLQRPRGHYRSNGELKPTAPTHVATRPDADKYLRCLLDALTGVIFVDDGQIAVLLGEKLYSDDGRTGATIEVEPIASTVPAAATRAPSPQAALPLEQEEEL